ncbi:MAG TPA: hypothetical protein DIU07_12430 [Rhodobacteraceae bacterium]|nr:hypothetical protein [Paracoccaceae bacterium]
MKLFAGLLLVMFSVLPEGTMAETVRVRSGDHAGFTRLVVDFTGEEDWVFGRVDGGFEFRPGREDMTYGLDRVFDKIGRTRIEDVRDLGDGRLYLGVGCNCHAVVDELSNGKVVLDIVAGPARAPGTGEDAELPAYGAQPEDQPGAATGDPVMTGGAVDPADKPVFVSNRAGLPLTLPQLGSLVPVPRDTTATAPQPPATSADPGLAVAIPAPGGSLDVHPTPQASVPPADDGSARADRIAKTEAALLEQVARAAAQGLLDADMSDIEENVAGTNPKPVDAPRPTPIAPPSPPVTQRGHITVETSVDRAASGSDRQGAETAQGEACIDPEIFDIGTWGDEIGNGTDIGAYRSGLITELDVADGAGVAKLVRNYIYITFGAEAKALMRRYPETVERPDLLFAMAEIMDEGRSTIAVDLVDQLTCAGATALWATLAQPELRPGQAVNRDAVASTFGALPAHLRRHLGPKLADVLLTSGDIDTADLIRAAIDRASEVPTSEYGMLTAQFELEAGKLDQATTILDDVVAAGDAVLPEALLQRVEATLAAGGAVPDDIVVLLDSLAFQFRGTETARQMVDAGIRARASAAGFAAAFEQLDTAADAGLFSPERSAELRERLYDRLTRDTDDTEFLRLSLSRIEETAGVSAPARRALVERLLDLGFAGPARQAMGNDGAMPDAADRQLLARAALAENRPAVAIGYLAGLADTSALSLRAEALDMARDHAGAMRAYEETGDQAKMVRMAWRGGLWPEVAQLDPGPIGAAARLMSGEPALRPDDVLPADQQDDGAAAQALGGVGTQAQVSDTPGRDATADQPALARAQALISESAAARQALGALLDEVISPAGDAVPEGIPGS